MTEKPWKKPWQNHDPLLLKDLGPLLERHLQLRHICHIQGAAQGEELRGAGVPGTKELGTFAAEPRALGKRGDSVNLKTGEIPRGN